VALRGTPSDQGTSSAVEVVTAESKPAPRARGRLANAKMFALAESVPIKKPPALTGESPRVEGESPAESKSGDKSSSPPPKILEPAQPAILVPTATAVPPTPVPSPTPVPPTLTPIPTDTAVPSPTEPPTKTFTPEPTHTPVPKPGQDVVLVDAPRDAALCIDGSSREFAREGASIRGHASAGQRKVALASRSRGFAMRSVKFEASESAVEIRFDDPDWSPSRYKVTLRVKSQHRVELERPLDDLEPIRLPFVDESVRIEVQASESKLVLVREDGRRLEKVCTWQGVDGCSAPPVLRCGSLLVP